MQVRKPESLQVTWGGSEPGSQRSRRHRMRIPKVGGGPEAVVPGSRNTAASDPGTDTQVGSVVLGSQAEDRDHWLSVDQVGAGGALGVEVSGVQADRSGCPLLQSRRTPEKGSRRCS